MSKSNDRTPDAHGRRSKKPQPAKAILQEMGLSQREVCRRFDLDQSPLCSILNGRFTPGYLYARAIVCATGRPPEELFDADLLERTSWYRVDPELWRYWLDNVEGAAKAGEGR